MSVGDQNIHLNIWIR